MMPMASDPWIDKITHACAYLARVDGHPSLGALARRFGGSPYHFQRTFKRIVGVTPREYAEACRLGRVKRRLRDTGAVTEAVFEAGYGSSGRFYERAAPRLGMPPSIYQKGGAGMQIRYAIVESSLGRVIVGTTSRGICSVALGASDTVLERALVDEYPLATLKRDDGGLGRWTNAVVALLAGRRPRIDLPLDIQATAFQWQVWKALAEIPRGETRTYSDIARAIGRPRAARAVGHACASNPVAVVIPCHRAVPAAGGVGNYRWGPQRKRTLLERERLS
jgi:AraC family transcriptional regulator of adaptative response/methylated-DNA-[protein]-cysteine methyltransferase